MDNTNYEHLIEIKTRMRDKYRRKARVTKSKPARDSFSHHAQTLDNRIEALKGMKDSEHC